MTTAETTAIRRRLAELGGSKITSGALPVDEANWHAWKLNLPGLTISVSRDECSTIDDAWDYFLQLRHEFGEGALVIYNFDDIEFLGWLARVEAVVIGEREGDYRLTMKRNYVGYWEITYFVIKGICAMGFAPAFHEAWALAIVALADKLKEEEG